MKFYNTLTRRSDEFKPLKKGEVSVYSCGPTVYDHVHIGNLRAYIMADTLRRVLRLNDYEVRHVMNFTDVDDKTIRRSHERYPEETAEEALRKLTREYEQLFLHDMRLVGNNVSALHFVRATESIEAMQRIIHELYEAGYAYITDDGVYFSIEKYRASGKTYGQLTDIPKSSESHAQPRIHNDEYDKDSARDFALWKIKKDNEPAWPFELDGHDMLGRPGWHIECSAMSRECLGQPFDIHTGGVDNIFPHHENEIAQSTANETTSVLANFFIHNEHLLVDNRKMAKSFNNFYTLRDIQERGFDPLAFRLLMLQAHYRTQTNFTWEALESAQNRLKRLRAFAALQWQILPGQSDSPSSANSKVVLDQLANDMNTPQALAYVSGYTEGKLDKLVFEGEKDEFMDFLKLVDAAFGLDLKSESDIDDRQKALLKRRQDARDTQDWSEADAIRAELQEQGIEIRDTAHGQIWSRV